MAAVTMADVSELIEATHKVLDGLIGDVTFEKELALFREVKAEKQFLQGRDWKQYYGVSVVDQGNFQPGTEGGVLPAAQAGDAVELMMQPVDMDFVLGWTLKQIKQMQKLGEKGAKLSLAAEYAKQARTMRRRMMCFFYGDGRGVLARALTGTGTTIIACDSDVPILCQKGDYIAAFTDRGCGTLSSGTLGTAPVKVRKISRKNNTITLNASKTWTSGEVISYASSSGVATTPCPMGLQSWLDDGTSTLLWDDASAAAYSNYGITGDVPATYLNKNRTDVPELLPVMTDNSASALDLALFIDGFMEAEDAGARPEDIVVILPADQRKVLVETLQGGVRFDSDMIPLPGSQMKLPALTGTGKTNIAVLPTRLIRQDTLAYLDKSKLRKIAVQGEYIRQGGGILHQIVDQATGRYKKEFAAFYVAHWNMGLFFPDTSHVMRVAAAT